MDPILTAAFSGRFQEFSDLLAERKAANHPRTAPSDEPLSWGADERKLVRLDHAIMACYLMTARVSLRSIASIKRQKLIALRNWLISYVAGELAAKLGGGGIGGILGFFLPNPVSVISHCAKFLRLDGIELETELAIRRQSIRCMRELREMILFKRSHRVRKTRLVFTRHESPTQRRANDTWTNPPAK